MTPAQRAAAERLSKRLHSDHPDYDPDFNEAAALLRELLAEPQGEPVAWQLLGSDSFLSAAAKMHHGVRAAAYDVPLYAHPPQQRPPTPVGWSDTDWLAHLSTMPPIAYALRDTLYGTSKAGVLRFCAADEPGAFAVYAHPPQQRRPLTDERIDLVLGSAYRALAAAGYTGGMGSTQWDHAAARAVERAITGEPT